MYNVKNTAYRFWSGTLVHDQMRMVQMVCYAYDPIIQHIKAYNHKMKVI